MIEEKIKVEEGSRTPLQRTTQRAYKRPTPQHSQKNRFLESSSTQPSFQDNRTCFKCGTKGHIAKNCKTVPYLVKLYKEHGERHDAHVTLSARMWKRITVKEANQFVTEYTDHGIKFEKRHGNMSCPCIVHFMSRIP